MKSPWPLLIVLVFICCHLKAYLTQTGIGFGLSALQDGSRLLLKDKFKKPPQIVFHCISLGLTSAMDSNVVFGRIKNNIFLVPVLIIIIINNSDNMI